MAVEKDEGDKMKPKFRQQTRVLSGREARRYGERERKREERQAQVDAFWALTPEERKRRMEDNAAFERINRNGITIEDLKMVEEQGRKDGFDMGTENAIKTCYAAFCLALHELHGFDTEQCKAVLAAADDKVVYALNADELMDEMKRTLDLEMDFKAGLGEERISEVGQ